jgi:hypothetical protein
VHEATFVAVILTGAIVAEGMDMAVEDDSVSVATMGVSGEEGVAVITMVAGWSGRMQAVMKRITNPRYRSIPRENRWR